ALEALFQVLRAPALSLRRAAVQAILGVRKSAEQMQKIRACLPPEQHFLLDLKRLKVYAAPQVPKPEKFLSDEARQRSPAKPPVAIKHGPRRQGAGSSPPKA